MKRGFDEMSKKQVNIETGLVKVSNAYFPMIERQLEENNIDMDQYAKQCVMNSITSINDVMDQKGIDWNDPQLDKNNITQILLSIASLKLNPSANPNEVFFQLRNVKRVSYDNGKKNEEWKKQIEMGIEGDGNDAILARFGRDVKQVINYWEVREGDDFEYPMYNGLELSPPKWRPKGKGKVIRVVYPIIKRGDLVEYHIAEREDVVRNLIAHINNNLINETFGIAENRYEANAKERAEIQKKKDEIINKVENLGLDKSLDDPEINKYVSPAWKSPQSKESMIVRKMRNNIVKKIPKDFGSTLTELNYDKTSNDYIDSNVQGEINENANSEFLEMDRNDVEDVEVIENDQSNESNDVGKEDKDNVSKERVEEMTLSKDDVPF